MRTISAAIICLMLAGAAAASPAAVPAQRPFRNLSVAVYIPVTSTRQLANPRTLRRQFQRIWSQVHFNKVYLEVYRDQVFANPATLDRIAAFFRRRGITVDGGITLFAYNNNTFIVESYLPRPATVRIFVRHGARELIDLRSAAAVLPAPIVTPSPLPSEQDETSFVVRLAPHSYRAFAVRF